MTQFLQISLTTLRNEIFKMASDNHNLLSYFPEIIKYQKAKMKFGKKLHKKVHNGCVLAKICNCHGNKDIQDGVRPAILNNFFIHKIFIFYETKLKYGNDLPIQVLNDLVFANFNNYFEE